jgi:hypothetical protein
MYVKKTALQHNLMSICLGIKNVKLTRGVKMETF